MKRRILAVAVFTCIMGIGLAGCGKSKGAEAAKGGIDQVEAKGLEETVSTDDFQITIRDGYTGRAYTKTKDLVVENEPGGGAQTDEPNADMIVINYSEGKAQPAGSSYFKIEKLKRQITDIREIAAGAAKLEDGEKINRTMEESTIGELWPDRAMDSLTDRPVYHVTTEITENDFMFEHFFFQTDTGVNMVVAILYPAGDETARRDMMDQFLGVRFFI